MAGVEIKQLLLGVLGHSFCGKRADGRGEVMEGVTVPSGLQGLLSIPLVPSNCCSVNPLPPASRPPRYRSLLIWLMGCRCAQCQAPIDLSHNFRFCYWKYAICLVRATAVNKWGKQRARVIVPYRAVLVIPRSSHICCFIPSLLMVAKMDSGYPAG